MIGLGHGRIRTFEDQSYEDRGRHMVWKRGCSFGPRALDRAKRSQRSRSDNSEPAGGLIRREVMAHAGNGGPNTPRRAHA
jgi:hypothetical protein